MIDAEMMEELRQDMLMEVWQEEQEEQKMRADDDFFGDKLDGYYDEHTVADTIEFIEHYDRDVDYWFDILLEK